MKIQLKISLAAVLLACGATGGYVLGQNQLTTSQQEVLDAYSRVENQGDPYGYAPLIKVYQKSVNDQDAANQIVRLGLASKGSSGSAHLLAFQVEQNQKIIEQNARIISLLEKIADKPAAATKAGAK